MTTWTLIIILSHIMFGPSGITTIDGFQTKEACLVTKDKFSFVRNVDTVCVEINKGIRKIEQTDK